MPGMIDGVVKRNVVLPQIGSIKGGELNLAYQMV